MSLSARAKEAKLAAEGVPIWDILSNLWDPETNPDGYLSLGLAENTLLHETLSSYITRKFELPTAALTYGDGMTGSNRLKKALSEFLTKRLKPFVPIEPNHVTVTNGCSSAIEHLSWAFADPGEGFLLGQPYYGTFIPDLTLRPASKVVPVPFHDVDPLSKAAIGKYEAALSKAKEDGITVKGLILCNPHNPLGRCYSRDVICGLMEFCENNGLQFISDEIYALSTWTEQVDSSPPLVPFQSALGIDTKGIIDPAKVHVIWGMSKDFGANGIRIGSIISQANPSLHYSFVLPSIYSSISSLSDHVTASLLEDEEWVDGYIKQNCKLLSKQHQRAVSWAKENNVPYSPGVNAAFFLWVDLGTAYKNNHPDQKIADIDKTVSKALLDSKVFLSAGKDFGCEQPGWFRIVFSHPDSFLQIGLDRVAKALK
ncbi:hypothetical protein TRICI_005454 [Trichomonascus ciferrii]|uniref:Aminotransferase class I/classII large domain-containing protein n=1 Tax=Trichomonascus ciferrii TaxID=44093 RepID=A0A642USI6_9ASCO|nr:hypothetical protein TRICI_005454 [Trichomonascus ciferrii]